MVGLWALCLCPTCWVTPSSALFLAWCSAPVRSLPPALPRPPSHTFGLFPVHVAPYHLREKRPLLTRTRSRLSFLPPRRASVACRAHVAGAVLRVRGHRRGDLCGADLHAQGLGDVDRRARAHEQRSQRIHQRRWGCTRLLDGLTALRPPGTAAIVGCDLTARGPGVPAPCVCVRVPAVGTGKADEAVNRSSLTELLLPLVRNPMFWVLLFLSAILTMIRTIFSDWLPFYLSTVLKVDDSVASYASAVQGMPTLPRAPFAATPISRSCRRPGGRCAVAGGRGRTRRSFQPPAPSQLSWAAGSLIARRRGTARAFPSPSSRFWPQPSWACGRSASTSTLKTLTVRRCRQRACGTPARPAVERRKPRSRARVCAVSWPAANGSAAL